MNFLWDNVFEYWKERRLGFLFLFTLVVLPFGLVFGVMIIAIISASGILEYIWLAMPGICIFAAALIWRSCRLSKIRKKNRYKRSILSRDELAKARSKLMTNSTNGKT